jgi:hypothetical protein
MVVTVRRCLVPILCLALIACQPDPEQGEPRAEPPRVPRGYVQRLQIDIDDRVLSFGPFVGYYFKPISGNDLRRLDFICFNEQSFYTRDLPSNARLFAGQAVLRRLPRTDTPVPANGNRIVPVFFPQAPAVWLDTRPEPQDEYRHFHSAYDDRGAVRYGYWLRHVAQAAFVYDMGGRVSDGSPLYHKVQPGIDKKFACIVEFDHGRPE